MFFHLTSYLFKGIISAFVSLFLLLCHSSTSKSLLSSSEFDMVSLKSFFSSSSKISAIFPPIKKPTAPPKIVERSLVTPDPNLEPR